MSALNSFQNRVYINLEILTRKKLIETLQSGVQILQINCTYIEEGYLCVENSNGSLDRISFKDLQNIFLPKRITSSGELPETNPNLKSTRSLFKETKELSDFILNSDHENDSFVNTEDFQDDIVETKEPQNIVFLENHMLKILVLCVKNNRPLVELFTKFRIPYIIAFEFTTKESRYKTCEDACMEHFCEHFYKELLAQKSILEAFNRAHDEALDSLSKYFEGKGREYIIKSIGPGPLLISLEDNHNEVIFNSKKGLLEKGHVKDISIPMCPTNIEEPKLPFVGRSQDFNEIIGKIQNKHIFLEIRGPSGVGKTCSVIQLSNYIRQRHMFPDGIFYIPLKGLKGSTNGGCPVNQYLQQILNQEKDFRYNSFFENKKMLLIFDNFELFYNEALKFPENLFVVLKQYKIPCLLLTTTGIENTSNNNREKIEEDIEETFLDESKKIDITGLSEEELTLLLQLYIKIKESSDFISIEQLKKCQIIQTAGGNPKKIIEGLISEKIKVQNKTLKISAAYKRQIDFNLVKHAWENKKSSSSGTRQPGFCAMGNQPVEEFAGLNFI